RAELLPSSFFQAEDGIRDFHVTGVQTCALPILRANTCEPVSRRPLSSSTSMKLLTKSLIASMTVFVPGSVPDVERRLHPDADHRSEERRVGKGWRGRWTGGQYKEEEAACEQRRW